MSLQRRMLLILGMSFSLLWLLAAFWMQRDLEQHLQDTLDQRLAASARMVGGLITQFPSDTWPALDATTLSASSTSGVACQIRDSQGSILLQTHKELPAEMGHAGIGFHNHLIDGQPWRIYTREENGLFISTADRLIERETLQRSIFLAAALPFIIALLGSLLTLWLGIQRGLRPLSRLKTALSHRNPASATPVDIGPTPEELAPVIRTLNTLLKHTGEILGREKRFTSDAAHELRTPLTAIKTHLQVARRIGPEKSDIYLCQAETALARLQKTLEQLLMLARVESSEDWPKSAPVSLRYLSDIAIADHSSSARLRTDISQHSILLPLPPELISIALRNLIDNALQHTDGTVTISITIEADSLHCNITDEGDHLSDEDMKRITLRFWRKPNSSGSGLGLAIVEAIVHRSGGRLSLNRESSGGLRAELILPIST
ncbi:MAG: sensor histidine kinase N-terminal domain-containing protein [Alcanivorax sp.]|nr:sensor histidine kinase N-terminal domain-containing protein [Alcanivorax sp.]